MKKLALFTFLNLLLSNVFSQTGYYINDTVFKYETWRTENQVDSAFQVQEDNSNYKAAFALYLMESYYEALKALDSLPQNHAKVISLKRNIYLGINDFARFNYFHGKLEKDYRQHFNFRRNFFSQFGIQPIITLSNNHNAGAPSQRFQFLIGTDINSKWSIYHEFSAMGQQNFDYGYAQTWYNLKSNYQLNENYGIIFNYKGVKLGGEHYLFGKKTTHDTISETGPIIDYHHEFTGGNGEINQGMNLSNLGVDYHKNRLELGIRLGVKNTNFSDRVDTEIKDSVVRVTYLPNGDSIINSSTVSSEYRNENSHYLKTNHQFSLKANYTPKWLNSSIKFESWVDVPFNSKSIGFSPYLKTKFKLTPNTWVGGWIRSYSGGGLTPMELGGTILNPGLDKVDLKYGGVIHFQKSKRWWITFNLELQKRKEYYTNDSYSTLTLDFNFLYRIYR